MKSEKYPYTYPFTYTGGVMKTLLNNTYFDDILFELESMVCANPQISLGMRMVRFTQLFAFLI